MFKFISIFQQWRHQTSNTPPLVVQAMNKEPQHCSLRHSVGYKLMFQAPRWQHVKITSLKSSEWTEQKNPSEDTRQKPGWDRVLFFVIQWKPTFLKNKSPPVQRILENLSASTRFGTFPTWGGISMIISGLSATRCRSGECSCLTAGKSDLDFECDWLDI